MTQKNYSRFADKWKHAAHPARPCKEELQVFEKFIKEHKKVLILGATPELRDLCHKYNLQVSLCDINPVMIKEMSKLIKHKGKERIYIGNWLKIPTDDTFDLILAEQSMNIVPIKDWDAFLKEVKRVLHSKGEFVSTISSLRDKKGHAKSLLEIAKEYNQYNRSVLYLHDRFIHTKHNYNKKTKVATIAKDVELCTKLYKQGLITKKEYALIQKKWGSIAKGNLVLYLLFQKELEKKLKKYFLINNSIVLPKAKDHTHKYKPFYVLKI